MRRVIGVAALCLLPISVLTVGMSGVASASTGVSCKVLSGNFATGTTGTISKCNDPANTGKSGTFPIAALGSGKGAITWATNHGKTSLVSVVPTQISPGTCPAGDSEYQVTGTVKKSTGLAAKSILKGWKVNAFACIDATGNLSLLAGTTLTIGP
jgi:hypothetical protein